MSYLSSFIINICVWYLWLPVPDYCREINGYIDFYVNPDQQMHNIYINNILYIIKYNYVFQCVDIIFKESNPFTLLKL